jgi:hypothetical protein
MKKLTTLLMLVGIVSGAQAQNVVDPLIYYPNFQYFTVYNEPTPFLRGNFNAWGKTPLLYANVDRYTVSHVAYVNIGSGTQQYKFDNSLSGDWSSNYGDNNTNDSCLDYFGSNIGFTQGEGTYEVTYRVTLTGAQGSSCQQPNYFTRKINSFSTAQRSMFLRTSFNEWKHLPMISVKNNVWAAYVQAIPNLMGSMKFDVKGDWSVNYGRSKPDPRAAINNGTAQQSSENIPLYAEDYSNSVQVPVQVRFNDQTLEYAVCSVGTNFRSSSAICN